MIFHTSMKDVEQSAVLNQKTGESEEENNSAEVQINAGEQVHENI